MGQTFTVDGIAYPLLSWTGGDTPSLLETGRAFMRIRGELYRAQWAAYVAYWYEAPGPDVRQTFWNRASLDAWRTVTERQRHVCYTCGQSCEPDQLHHSWCLIHRS